MLQYIMHREHVAQYRWPQSIQENNYIWKVITLYAIFPLQIFLSLSFPSLCLLHEVSWSVCDDGIFCPLASYTGKCTQSYICTPYRHIMAVHSILLCVSLNSYILIISTINTLSQLLLKQIFMNFQYHILTLISTYYTIIYNIINASYSTDGNVKINCIYAVIMSSLQ